MEEIKELGMKVAQDKNEELLLNAIESTEKRIREQELIIEIDKEVLKFLIQKREALNKSNP